MSPKVSVILPTFNRAQTLPAAMQSVLEQSYKDLELIVVDDASTEDIKGVVERMGDPRIVYIRNERNQGAAGARNTGLSEARGPLIAFQDSDDLWLPRKLERQVADLEAQPPEIGAVIGLKILYGRDANRVFGPGRVACAPDPQRPLTLEEDQLKRVLIDSRISLQNSLFRRNCLPTMVWFDPLIRANVDWEFTIRLAQNTRILERVEPVVLAMISDDSVSTKPRKRAVGYLRILKKHQDLYSRYPEEQGIFLYNLGNTLRRAGHPRLARKLLMRSLMLRPRNALRGAGALRAKLKLS